MELKEFIKTVLVDVCEAKNAVEEGAIAPGSIDGVLVEREQLINFEISVSASDSLEGGGEGKIQVLSLGVAAGTKVNKETQSINKISFQVPVYYSAKYNNKQSTGDKF